MKHPIFLDVKAPTRSKKDKYLALFVSLILIGSLAFLYSAKSQTRPRITGQASIPPDKTDAAGVGSEVLKVDVDLITVDALVLQKQTARVVGSLTKDDFVLAEDNVPQQITHFSQNSLPLSVLFLVDRGGCLDPFGSEVRAAARNAMGQLKPTDEVALMTYHTNVELRQAFTRNRSTISDALDDVPPKDEQAGHCLNKALADAAQYMQRAGNPIGRRVIVLITGVTRSFDCTDGPSNKTASQAVYESGAVVSAIVPKTSGQQMENGVMIWATRFGRLGGAPYIDIQTLANETGGEIMKDKPQNLSTTFNTLINHLRTRYNLAFVSTNKKRDGTTRKLKIDVAPSTQKANGKLVVKARRSYVAPR